MNTLGKVVERIEAKRTVHTKGRYSTDIYLFCLFKRLLKTERAHY